MSNVACAASFAFVLWLAVAAPVLAQGDIGPDLQSGSCAASADVHIDAYPTARARSGGLAVPISVEGGIVVVEAMIEGSGPFPMMLDTGAVDVITLETAAALGLKIEGGTGVLRGNAEHDQVVASTHVSQVRLADAEMGTQSFLVLNLPRFLADRSTRPPLSGFLGYQLFTNFVVRLDYQNHLLTLSAPDTFRYEGTGVCVPFALRDKTPSVVAQADGIRGLFAIDTGSTGGLVFSRSFVELNNLETRHPGGLRIQNAGVDGIFENVVTRLDRFDLANATIERPLSQFPAREKRGLAIKDVGGSIGYEILQQFVITFDYSRHAMWFEKSPVFGTKTAGGKTGFQAAKIEGPNYRVVNVIADTPAAVAGLKVGDAITEIDGIPAEAIGRAEFAQLMRRPDGTVVHLRARRNGSEQVFTLTLKELVP